jgi:uncharacterized Tic20 family protein
MSDLYARPLGQPEKKPNQAALACLLTALMGAAFAFGLLLGAVFWRP